MGPPTFQSIWSGGFLAKAVPNALISIVLGYLGEFADWANAHVVYVFPKIPLVMLDEFVE